MCQVATAGGAETAAIAADVIGATHAAGELTAAEMALLLETVNACGEE